MSVRAATAALSLLLVLAPRAATAGYKITGLGKNTDQPPAIMQEIDVVEQLGGRMPLDVPLTDSHGKPRVFGEFLGDRRPLILTLGYYGCPMLCDLVDKGLAAGINAAGLTLGKDYRVLTVSINPEDKPMNAAEKQLGTMRVLGHVGTRDDWTFAVTTADGARRLAQAVGFKYAYDPQSKQFAHAALAVVITPEGVVSRYLYGLEFPGNQLKLALVEASGGRVGTSFDRFVLSCFRFDPALRKYHLIPWVIFKIGGSLILVSVGTLMAVLWGREFKNRKLARGGAAA